MSETPEVPVEETEDDDVKSPEQQAKWDANKQRVADAKAARDADKGK